MAHDANKGVGMLGELLDVALDLTDSCAPCAGNDPSNVVWPGTVTSTPASGTPDFGRPEDRPGPDSERQETPRKQREDKARSDRERELELQRKNSKDTIFGLAWEWVTSPAGGLGKVIGPLGTVAAGAEPLAEGVANVREADIIREDRIYRETQGAMGKPRPDAPKTSGKPNRAPADTPSSPGPDTPQTEAERRAQEHFERTMENIRIKEQVRQAGNAGKDIWKDWR